MNKGDLLCVLQSMKNNQYDEELQQCGCTIVMNMISRYGAQQLCLQEDGVVDLLLVAMNTHIRNEALNGVACAALHALRDILIFAGVYNKFIVKILVIAMRVHQFSHIVQLPGCEVLGILSTIACYYKDVIEHGVLTCTKTATQIFPGDYKINCVHLDLLTSVVYNNAHCKM